VTDWSKLGRRNKDRGKAFERKIAEFLGWRKVPYSGQAASAWGPGDIVDGDLTSGYWLVECKTQPRGTENNISIKDSWITKTIAEAQRSGRFPVLIVNTTRSKLVDSLVFVPVFALPADKLPDMLPYMQQQYNVRARGRGIGFVFRRKFIDEEWQAAALVVQRKGDDDRYWLWVVLRLERFRRWVKQSGLEGTI